MRLTLRQREAIELRAKGLSLKEIADRMGIVEGTVKMHCTMACRASGVNVRSLVGKLAREDASDILRRYSITLKDWKERHDAELPASVKVELSQILLAMLSDWAELTPDTEAAANSGSQTQSPAPIVERDRSC